MPEPASHVTSITLGQYWPARPQARGTPQPGNRSGISRGAGNNGPVSTAMASSFLNAAGTMGGRRSASGFRRPGGSGGS
jgi:hypothetical protein